MICSVQLVMNHIKSILPPGLDYFQFVYWSDCSTDHAISSALDPALTHLYQNKSYVRMLFINFSSTCNIIISQQLLRKLTGLGYNTSLQMAAGFLHCVQCPQAVRVVTSTFNTIILSTGAPWFNINHQVSRIWIRITQLYWSWIQLFKLQLHY